MAAEPLLDLQEFAGHVGRNERYFCFGVFEEVGDCLDLAVRIERHADGAMVKRAEISESPAGMVFADKGNAVAFADVFLSEPICYGADLAKAFAERINLAVVADYTHRHIVGSGIEFGDQSLYVRI